MQLQSMRVLVTGGNGFLGRALCERFIKEGHSVRASVRAGFPSAPTGVEVVRGELLPAYDWSESLRGVDLVIHAAARVHVLRDNARVPLEEFRRANVEAALNMATQAAAAGVRRFIFVSSVGVNGLETNAAAFSEQDPAAPCTPYAVSKHEAEQGLKKISAQTGLDIVIVRSPLIHGPNAPGNFAALVRAVTHGWPLPLGAIRNKRSLVGLDNLVDFLYTCSIHPQAANETFLISDGEDISTPELVRRLAIFMRRPVRLLYVPPWVLRTVGAALGRGTAMQGLCSSLCVDTRKAATLLGWRPLLTLNEGLRRVNPERDRPENA